MLWIVVALLISGVPAGRAQVSLTINNDGFETGSPTQAPSGWTVASGSNPFWIGNSQVGSPNPGGTYEGSNFISASWEMAGLANANSLIGGADNSALIYQDIDLTPHGALIGQGDRYLGLSYAYFINDGNDFGLINYDFYDSSDSVVGRYSIEAQASGSVWQHVENLTAAPVPSSAARLRISIGAGLNPGMFGSARNVAFDAIAASLQPAPSPETPRDRVNGNLIEFNNDGAWSWYMDERLIRDQTNGHYLVNSITSSNVTNLPGGVVRVTSFDPATGTRLTRSLADIDEDDHNAGGLLVLPDGRYLTLYSNHGSPYNGDNFTRWRVSTNPHDASSWALERTFDWSTTPGWDQGPFAGSGVSYHNLYYLPAEGRVINFSRGTHMAMNAVEYDPQTNTVTWLGETQRSRTVNYGQGYFKYASNGHDKVYFIATQTHPYDVNTSIFSGYYSAGETFNMDGTLMDANTFDNLQSAPGATVPYTEDFTLVQAADEVGAGYNYLWTADLAVHPDGTLAGLYTSKFNGNDLDQRLHYAYWNGASWETHEVAKMGEFLFVSQEEYTGVGAVSPNQPGVIY
ncbi:MAG: BNR-4 repeat-containing protein, partial [Planctomycetales bacterium]|nr:BNR-4 repeat-containing protein [Planctomycetales bacterium]